MKPSLLALATLVAYAGAAQATTQGNPPSSDTTLTNSGQLASTAARTVTLGPSTVTILKELKIASVAAACGCYPNNCGG